MNSEKKIKREVGGGGGEKNRGLSWSGRRRVRKYSE